MRPLQNSGLSTGPGLVLAAAQGEATAAIAGRFRLRTVMQRFSSRHLERHREDAAWVMYASIFGNSPDMEAD